MNYPLAKWLYRCLPQAIQRRLYDPRQFGLRRRLKRRLLAHYRGTPDPEIREVLAFIRKYKLTTFNYEFIFKYETRDVDVRRDETCGLLYVVENGKRLYFKRDIADPHLAADYYNAMCKEQDPRSPHGYTSATHAVSGGALLDLGAAEGLFSLRHVEAADVLYLFECDPGWIEALRHTFKPYADKVHLVPKYVSDRNDEREISLDEFAKSVSAKISFVKMDIEGAELRTLAGAREMRRNHPDCRWSICVYHHPDDERQVREELRGSRVTPAPGYMLFYFDKTLAPPFLRRGVLHVDP
ncbi:MAG TPA: FkbM family methyltransferase [Kiritimatiellia bacterium]|nr:FkbM family methyltransferase [Kiritimatiellia bacterium]